LSNSIEEKRNEFRNDLIEAGFLIDPENFSQRELKKVKKGLFAQAVRMIYCSDFFGHASAVNILKRLRSEYTTEAGNGVSLSNSANILGLLAYGRYSEYLTEEEREEALNEIEDVIEILVLQGIASDKILEDYAEFKRYMVSGEFDAF